VRLSQCPGARGLQPFQGWRGTREGRGPWPQRCCSAGCWCAGQSSWQTADTSRYTGAPTHRGTPSLSARSLLPSRLLLGFPFWAPPSGLLEMASLILELHGSLHRYSVALPWEAVQKTPRSPSRSCFIPSSQEKKRQATAELQARSSARKGLVSGDVSVARGCLLWVPL